MSSHSRIRILFKLHSYTGLITGIALLLIGISGSILVFSRDLNHMIYRNILEVEPSGMRITLDSGFHLIKSRFPAMDYITYDGLPQDEKSTFEFFMMKGDVQFKAFLNPYTGELLHQGKRYDYWMDWLLLFHYTFTIPVWGEFTAAILSLTLLLSIVTGAIVYRKYIVKVLTFNVGFRFKNWRTLSSSLHRIVGVWSLIFHVLIAFTAFWMLRHTFTANHFTPKSTIAVPAPALQFSIDQKLIDIKSKYPQFHAQFLTLPETEGTPAYFYGHSQGVSFFFANYYDEVSATRDSINSKFLHEKSAGEKFESLMYPVHAGHYGSLPIKIVYCLGGLTPALLSITGFILWWRRRG